MKIADLKIGTRLGLGFAIQLLLLAAAVALGMFELSRMNQQLLLITSKNNVINNATATMRSSQLSVSLAVSQLVMLSDADQKGELSRRMKEARDSYDAADAGMRGMITRVEGKALMERIDAGRNETRPLMEKARRLGMEGNNAEAVAALTTEVAPAAARWQAALTDMMVQQARYTAQASEEAADAYAEARTLMLAIGAVALALGVLIAWLATRSITRPIGQALVIAQTVAAGDLTSRIDVMSRDETGALMAALKTMNGNLQQIVGQVRQGTDTIACASTQIASGNLDLSARTEQQASSLEETAASMEELTTTVKQNSDNARQANVLAEKASEVAQQGGAVVGKVVETMSSINESSRKIVDIIGVIDGIAFQTNILALNAAVEAARAGEQGRGFAVVATEVRNLAQRSAGAAKEIKMLIDDSVAKVALGSTLVNEAGGTMEEVVASVRRVTDMMGEISAAGREQETGISQINQAVMEMDAVTQQNAALVEEAAAAAESLQDQASRLTESVSVFKLDQVAAPAARVVALKPAARTAPPARVAPQRKQIANGAPQGDWEEF